MDGTNTRARTPALHQPLLAAANSHAPAWQRALYAFLAEKERRSGSKRTVETYARMLWPFFERTGSPDRVTPTLILAYAHGPGRSGRTPSTATVTVAVPVVLPAGIVIGLALMV